MAIAADFAALASVWGQTLTVVRRSVSYSDSGGETQTYATVVAVTGMIQPYTRKGETVRVEAGIKAKDLYEIYLPNGTDARTADRIRPTGWAAGDDEYEIIDQNEQTPSHINLIAEKTRGHGG